MDSETIQARGIIVKNIENIKPLLLCVGNGGPHDESHFPLDDKWSKLNLLQEGTDLEHFISSTLINLLRIYVCPLRYLESPPSRDIPLRFPNDYLVTIVTTSKHHFFGFYLKTIAGSLASIA